MNLDHLNTLECCIRDCQANMQQTLEFNQRVMLAVIVLPITYVGAVQLCQHILDHGFVTIGGTI